MRGCLCASSCSVHAPRACTRPRRPHRFPRFPTSSHARRYRCRCQRRCPPLLAIRLSNFAQLPRKLTRARARACARPCTHSPTHALAHAHARTRQPSPSCRLPTQLSALAISPLLCRSAQGVWLRMGMQPRNSRSRLCNAFAFRFSFPKSKESSRGHRAAIRFNPFFFFTSSINLEVIDSSAIPCETYFGPDSAASRCCASLRF